MKTKKGQIEDFVADMIPSLIIIIIGLYVMSNMHNVNEDMINEKKLMIEGYLQDEQYVTKNYLEKEIKVDGVNMLLKELISLSYRNEDYTKKVKNEISETYGKQKFPVYFKSETFCLKIEIKYPDGSTLTTCETKCEGEEEKIMLPTYDGKNIELVFTKGGEIKDE